MNGLDGLIALALAAFAAALAAYARRGSNRTKSLTAGFAFVVLVSSVAVYAGFGRYADYMLAAKIAEARRMVKNMPRNAQAHSQLAEALYEAGQYDEAVEVFNALLMLDGARAETLGRLARAMYYRDARNLTDETRRVIERVLSANPLDVQTRMLLGEDAFLHQRYDEAVRHWKMLLDAGVAPEQQRALRNAIANAESRARLQD